MLGGHRLLLTYKLSLGVLLWFHMGCAVGAGGAELEQGRGIPSCYCCGESQARLL